MLCFVFFSAVRKDLKVETDDRMQQFKKKAKELRILDPKTAQNLCELELHLYILFCNIHQQIALKVQEKSKKLIHL